MVTETVTVSSSSKAVSASADTGSIKKSSDNRRSNKPIMEKRRRARINNCLNELKTLILDAMKKDPARHSKLEKADILEMTVKHLQNMQRLNISNSSSTTENVTNKFRAGFSECASEVGKFPGLDPQVRRRLLQHLASSLSQKAQEPHAVEHASVLVDQNTGVQLVPTRLPNGDIALVLPNAPSTSNHSSVLPLLVPMPTRTMSSSSASSYSSGSPEPMERYSPPMQKPLALVMRKMPVDTNEKPWRPW